MVVLVSCVQFHLLDYDYYCCYCLNTSVQSRTLVGNCHSDCGYE